MMDEEELRGSKETCFLSKTETAAAMHSTTQKILDKAVHHRHGRSVPIGIIYVTEKAEEDKDQRLIAARNLSLKNMSDAHRHFRRTCPMPIDTSAESMHLTTQKLLSVAMSEPKSPIFGRMINALLPAAMERFTAKGGESQAKKNKAEPEKCPDEDPKSEAGSPIKSSALTTAADIDDQPENVISREETPAPVIDRRSQSLYGRKLLKDGDVHGYSPVKMQDWASLPLTPQTSEDSDDDTAGPFSALEVRELFKDGDVHSHSTAEMEGWAPLPLTPQTSEDSIDDKTGTLSALDVRELFKDGNVLGHSTAEMEDRAPLLVTPRTSYGSLDDKAGPFSEKEPIEAEFKTVGAKLVLEVFGSTGAIWGFSEVLTLRNPATVWLWRPLSLAFGALFFLRWMKEVRDYYAEEDLELFGDQVQSAPNNDELPLQDTKGCGSSMTNQRNESWGFGDVDPQMVFLHGEACDNSKMNETMESDKTSETENEENSLIGSQVTFRDIAERSRSSKYIDWGHEPIEKPNELYRIFGAKLVLEVFGGSGAIWGSSEILVLRDAANAWFWRPVALGFTAVFLVRWSLQIMDCLAEERLAEMEPRARLRQIFGAKLVLEVFGGAGAVWGFSEALTLRDGANAWFWRPVALAFGAIFFFRWGMQIQDYCAEENLEGRRGCACAGGRADPAPTNQDAGRLTYN